MFPKRLLFISKFFRGRRNRRLCEQIEQLHAEKGDLINVLDIGGSYVFWLTIPARYRAMCRISLLNLPGSYGPHFSDEELAIRDTVASLEGDARSMGQFADGSFDLVISNSVIEHVGNWMDMRAAAAEALRLGRHGWIQVPAFEFPIEQHYLAPLAHWFADPIQQRLLRLFNANFRRRDADQRYMGMYHIRPLSRGQLRLLFPQARHGSEWLVFPKSHMARW